MFQRIMVAFDESPESGRALQTAIKMTAAFHAELTVVTVLEPLPIYYSFGVSPLPANKWTTEHRLKATVLQAEARKQAELSGIKLHAEIVSGDEVETIVTSAKQYQANLLVLGMRRHTLMVGGHTAQDVVEHSPCAVLGIR